MVERQLLLPRRGTDRTQFSEHLLPGVREGPEKVGRSFEGARICPDNWKHICHTFARFLGQFGVCTEKNVKLHGILCKILISLKVSRFHVIT